MNAYKDYRVQQGDEILERKWDFFLFFFPPFSHLHTIQKLMSSYRPNNEKTINLQVWWYFFLKLKKKGKNNKKNFSYFSSNESSSIRCNSSLSSLERRSSSSAVSRAERTRASARRLASSCASAVIPPDDEASTGFNPNSTGNPKLASIALRDRQRDTIYSGLASVLPK